MTIQATFPQTFRAALKRALLCMVQGLRSDDAPGAEHRFNALLSDHQAMIRRICFGYARSAAELDDLYQDALLNIWQALPRFRGDCDTRTWVYRITLNTCVSALRLRSRRPRQESLDALYVEAIIDDDAERRRLVAELHQAISRLQALDKAIVLAWLDGFAYDEIADMTGLPRNTVATRLRRARLRLTSLTENP